MKISAWIEMAGLAASSPLTSLLRRLQSEDYAAAIVAGVRSNANSRKAYNTYIHFDPLDVQTQADALAGRAASLPLPFVPVSLKDCFDLAGTRTTLGCRFYAEHNPIASEDSVVARRLRECGCLITGKTHLHPLAYGITGQNPDFGDCVQPRDGSLLTGGSSSGAAASVQEGSALAAIGTDTGGSIRVPAALCGLTGYRASHSTAESGGLWPEMWQGAWALAPSFDTLGFMCRDPRDAAPLAHSIFRLHPGPAPERMRIGCVPLTFLHDATDDVFEGYRAWKQQLLWMGASLAEFDPSPWSNGSEIFTAIQAYEASVIHAGHLDEFGPLLAQRLHGGASIPAADLAVLRERHLHFRAELSRLFESFDFLMLPCAHVARLGASEDHSTTRGTILRYTVPFSLGGVPVVTLPGELLGAPLGTGIQIAAAQGRDAMLLAFAGEIGDRIACG